MLRGKQTGLLGLDKLYVLEQITNSPPDLSIATDINLDTLDTARSSLGVGGRSL